MIERMKKITLLVSEREREMFILKLRKRGVLHIKHARAPLAHEIRFVEEKVANVEKMVSILSPYHEKGKEKAFTGDEKELLECAAEVAEIYDQRQDLAARVEDLRGRIRWFEHWGEFDPEDLEKIRAEGANIRLYRVRKDEVREIAKGIRYTVTSMEAGYTYLVAVFLRHDERLPFEEMIPPPESPYRMRQKIDDLNGRIEELDALLREEAMMLRGLKQCENRLKKDREFLNVKFGMQEEGVFSYLQGFCPVKTLKKITSMAKAHGLGYFIEDPDKPEETPTLITNPGWIRTINPVFQFMNMRPGYDEFDISVYFLVFFSLFFAMLIGDAGYGFLFLLVTFAARRKLRDLPKEPFFLMYILSGATIVWGAITGTWFGAERIAQVPFLNALVIERVNSFADNNQNNIIFLCFVIGAVQLTIAHFLRAVRTINSVRALAEVGWVLILWGMFFAAGKFVLGNPFPQAAGWLFAVGPALVLVFTNPEKGILKGALNELAHLPLKVISSFSDIVSYLRLFAVGYASVVVAESFNNMALAGGVRGVLGAVAAALILFLGHALNIILGFMAVIVHGIRLNMLEFSGHLGMQWSGVKYEPYGE